MKDYFGKIGLTTYRPLGTSPSIAMSCKKQIGNSLTISIISIRRESRAVNVKAEKSVSIAL